MTKIIDLNPPDAWYCVRCGRQIYTGTHTCGEEIFISPECAPNIAETPKRCDECSYWKKYGLYDNSGYCGNTEVCDYGSGCEYSFACPPDFYCKYWEKKEE